MEGTARTPGLPRLRPEKLHADKGKDYQALALFLDRRKHRILAAARQGFGLPRRWHTGHAGPLRTLGCVQINLRRLVQQES